VPFLKDIFSRMLSMLGSVKADNLRWVFSSCKYIQLLLFVASFYNIIFHFILLMIRFDLLSFYLGIGSFSEAILEYCANIENAPYPDITKERFSGEIFTAFEIMFGVWLNSSKEARVFTYTSFSYWLVLDNV